MRTANSGRQKLGVVIYLRTFAPLAVAKLVSDFQERWSGTAFELERSEEDCSYFSIGPRPSRIVVEVRRARVPDPVTNSILDASLDWPSAKRDLAHHTAHIGVAASLNGGDALLLASDLTKSIVSLLKISDSIGVAWLNAPVLFPTDDFCNIATELLTLNVHPCMLWVAPQWIPEGRLVYTKGMAQFGAPEIFLAEQSGPSPEIVMYLFDLVNYVLTSGNALLDGETIDGPNGVFRIDSLRASESGKKGLFLVPVRSN
jgi:hypothetical protein